jgi:hypothetical protein
MTSTAKVTLSSQATRILGAPSRRPARWSWLELVREAFGGALLLAVWLALWTTTWAAVAGPLAPAPDRPGVVEMLD